MSGGPAWPPEPALEAQLNVVLNASGEDRDAQSTVILAGFDSKIEADPSRWDPYYCKGVMLQELKGEYKRALECFKTAIQLEPRCAEAHYRIAVCMINPAAGEISSGAGDHKASGEGGSSAVGSPVAEKQPDASSAPTPLALSPAGPDSPKAADGGAISNPEQAAILRKEAAVQRKEAAELRRREESEQRRAAEKAEKQRQKQEAAVVEQCIASLGKAIEYDPNHKYAYVALGDIWGERKGDPEKAVSFYISALKSDPAFIPALDQLSWKLKELGRSDEAIGYCRDLVSLDPGYDLGQFRLASLLAERGDIEEAQKHFEECLEVNPRFSQGHDALGLLLYRKECVDDAIDHFKKAISLMPGNYSAHFNLASAYRDRKNDLEGAIEHYKEVLRLVPDSEEADERLRQAQDDLVNQPRITVSLYIEHCIDCHLHQRTTRHKPGSYEKHCTDLVKEVSKKLPEVVVVVNKGLDRKANVLPRVGSYEISMYVAPVDGGPQYHYPIYSKLENARMPDIESVLDHVQYILLDTKYMTCRIVRPPGPKAKKVQARAVSASDDGGRPDSTEQASD